MKAKQGICWKVERLTNTKKLLIIYVFNVKAILSFAPDPLVTLYPSLRNSKECILLECWPWFATIDDITPNQPTTDTWKILRRYEHACVSHHHHHLCVLNKRIRYKFFINFGCCCTLPVQRKLSTSLFSEAMKLHFLLITHKLWQIQGGQFLCVFHGWSHCP